MVATPLHISRLLENWFKGTLYVQQIRIGCYGIDADVLVGWLLLPGWLRLGQRLPQHGMSTLQ
jgi:hypothetical protein